jgi:hypothetical protein
VRARWLALAAVYGALLLVGASSASAQARFDLRDWTRKPVPDSTTAFFECNAEKFCGDGSRVSAHQNARPKEPLTISGMRTREQAVVKRMKEQSEGRIKNIELGETRETLVDGLPLFYTEKKIRAKGDPQIYVGGIMVGKTKAYSIIASGEAAIQVRSNFQGFARIVALILGELAVDAPKSEGQKSP